MNPTLSMLPAARSGSASPTAPTTSTAPAGRAASAALFIGTGLLAFAPLVVLGPAIGWPASLGAPAAQQLAAIARAPQAVATGYGLYLLYSVLILPLMVLVAHRVWGDLSRPVAQIVIGFAALSVLARSIGILRWLTVMPELAVTHTSASPTMKPFIELTFDALSTYGGGIGELLGVSLFMAVSVGVAVVAALKQPKATRPIPTWLAALGLVSAALLFGLFLPAVGIAIEVSVAAAVTTLSVWMLAFGAWTAFSRKASLPAA
jgi:Domain of unknown function (DUF4386)